MMLGGGGKAMLSAVFPDGAQVQPDEAGDRDDWREVIRPFRTVYLPGRGKYAGLSVAAVAERFPKYIVFSYEKGTGHMGIPKDLYLMCLDAVVRSKPLSHVCRDIRRGSWIMHPDALRYRGNMACRLHTFPDPEERAPQHPNCRSVVLAVQPEPEEPSFLDEVAAEEDGGSFLDGIL